MIAEIILFVTFLFLIIQLNKKPKDFPPGKWGVPVLGMFPTLPRGRKYLQMLEDCRKKFGDIFCIRFGSMRIVYVCNYELIKEAYGKLELSDRPMDLLLFQAFRNFKNLGILFASGEDWRRNRRFALFHLKNFGLGKRSMEDIIQKEIHFLLDEWDKLTDKPSHIDRAVNVATLNVIWEISAAKRFDINDKEINEFTAMMTENLKRLDGPIALLHVFPWLMKVLPNIILNGWMEVDQLKSSNARMINYFEKIIDEHAETLDVDNPRDFIDVYLNEMRKEENKDTFTSEDLAVTLSDLFMAGCETVSTTLRWLLLYMAAYPKIQEKVFEEIRSVVGPDTLPSLIHKDRLPYTEAVTLEMNRIASFTATEEHAAGEDTELAGYKIPKGTHIYAGFIFCHRSPKYWEKPDELHPEHFLDENGKCITRKDGYVPFSVGRRVCIGEAMGRMSLYLFSAAILQRYKIEPPEGCNVNLEPDPKSHFLTYAQDQPIVLKRRD